MATSTRYRELTNELHKLRRDLLPKNFRSSGNYKDEDITRTRAYRVLVHAEIESYLEDRARDIALAAAKSWHSENKASKTLMALVAFSGRNMDKPPNSISPEQTTQTSHWDEKIKLSRKIALAMNDFISVLNQNHGIKEENIIGLLLPIGIDCNELDAVLIADLNSYGTSRGLVAHKAYQSYSMTEQIDPREELRKVTALVKGMTSIDKLLDKLSSAL